MVPAPADLTSNNPLEQFVLLAKYATGAACSELVKQVLEAPGVYVFGQLLDMPNVKELEDGRYRVVHDTLKLFAYGTYKNYLEKKDSYLDLSSLQKKKLQHLTIVTLATKSKCIPYSVLLDELDLKVVRDLEDLIIEAIYADILQGKIDQKNRQFEVDYAIGRDIRSVEVGIIVSTLEDWCGACEAVLSCVEAQIDRANCEKNKVVKHQDAIEREVINIKKTLKSQAQQQALEDDEIFNSENREAMAGIDKGKKIVRPKSARASGIKERIAAQVYAAAAREHRRKYDRAVNNN